MENIFTKNCVVSFSTKRGEVLAVKNPKIVNILDKKYIAGTVPKSSTVNDFALDKKCYILFDEITDFIIYESENDYVEAMKKSETNL